MTAKVTSPVYTPATPAAGVGIVTAGAGVIGSLQGEINRLALIVQEEQAHRIHLEQTLQLVLQEMSAYRARLDKLDPPISPLRAAVQRVEARGNIRVNHQTGQVSLLHSIQFQPRTTRDPPTAIFANPEVANEICRDLAEIANLFNCPMTIEGHTKGGESEFWHQLANDRARIVVDLMLAHGARGELLTARGRPGKLGNNEAKTKVFMDIANIADERMPSVTVLRQVSAPSRVVSEIVSPSTSVIHPVETITPQVLVASDQGHVVRRSFSAGNEYERDIMMPGALTERDVYVGGRLVERQFQQSSPTTSFMERDIVTADGRLFEYVDEPPVRVTAARVINSPLHTPMSAPATARGIGTPTTGSFPLTAARVINSVPPPSARRIILSSNGASTPI
mmetsp:Transcript_41478/g.73553  ORF Transcript_41478/g.73553 Transcript_41478/m.73553 type:complete len:394 (-) Transcript_41478:180-1361(-)